MIDCIALAAKRNAERMLAEDQVFAAKKKIENIRRERQRIYSKTFRERKKNDEDYIRRRREIARKKWAENPEHYRKKSRENYAAHKEQRKKYSAKYYAENHAQLMLQKREYYLSHKEEIKERDKAYRAANRELVIAKQRVRNRVAMHPELLEEFSLRELFQNEFDRCGIAFPDSLRFNNWLKKKEAENDRTNLA